MGSAVDLDAVRNVASRQHNSARRLITCSLGTSSAMTFVLRGVELGACTRKLVMLCDGVLKNRAPFDPAWASKKAR